MRTDLGPNREPDAYPPWRHLNCVQRISPSTVTLLGGTQEGKAPSILIGVPLDFSRSHVPNFELWSQAAEKSSDRGGFLPRLENQPSHSFLGYNLS